MLKKVIFILVLISFSSFAMSAIDVQQTDKKILGCIKGVGEKRLNNILIYRKEHKIIELSDLLNVSGIGQVILKNIKQDIKKKACLVNKQKALPKQSKPRISKKSIGAL